VAEPNFRDDHRTGTVTGTYTLPLAVPGPAALTLTLPGRSWQAATGSVNELEVRVGAPESIGKLRLRGQPAPHPAATRLSRLRASKFRRLRLGSSGLMEMESRALQVTSCSSVPPS